MDNLSEPGAGNRCCIITGGTAGIGLATARRLAEMGGRVAIVGRNAERGAAALALLREVAGAERAEFLAADLPDQNQVRSLAETILNGEYFVRCRPVQPSAAARLWRESLRLTGLDDTGISP